jgi:hypothetical protein
MALSGLEIYKLLPQTDCQDCGFPTCLAFAMKLAAKQTELDKCPHVPDEAREKLAESAAPPAPLAALGAEGRETGAGVPTGEAGLEAGPAPTSPSPVFNMREQTVGTQVNVGGDYVDRRSTVIVGDGNVVGDRSSSRVVKGGVGVSDGEPGGREAADVESLRRRLAEARENLRLVEEREAEFVLGTDVPLQLVKEKRRLRRRIVNLEARLEALDHQRFESGNLPESGDRSGR